MGQPLADVLNALTTAVVQYKPMALVGHDITNDLMLLVSEAVRCGLPIRNFLPLRRLLCTKHATVGLCAIPLPQHLRSEYSCDVEVERLSGGKSTHTRTAHSNLLKWPNLEESYQCVLGKPKSIWDTELSYSPLATQEQHDARGDVARCRVVLLYLLRAAERMKP